MDNWWRLRRPCLISILNYIGIKKAGDFQLVFTFSESRHHSQHCGDRLQLQRREAGSNFAGTFYRRQGRHGGVHGGAGGGVVGLRRMERSEHGVGGDPQSGTQHSAGADLRRGAGGRAVHAGECGGAVCAAGGGRSRLRRGRRPMPWRWCWAGWERAWFRRRWRSPCWWP